MGGAADGNAAELVAHRSALGEWVRCWQRPSQPLRGLVAGYTGYRQQLATPASHRGVPGPTLPLVISFGPAQTISWPAGARSTTPAGSFVAGLFEHHVTIDAAAYHGIQVDLHPLGATRLLGQPLGGLTGAVVPLEAALGGEADRLVDDLASAEGWPACFATLDRFLRRRMAARPAPSAELVWVWEQIAASRGQVRVDRLAGELGWSARRLRARFGETVGLPPKRAARLVRFAHAAGLLDDPGAGGLAAVAAAAGYADQAHLSREVAAFSGLSPRALAARRLPDAGGVFDLDR